ncbi:MAG TPA: LysE family translocator [Usitatibacteraceae bacterium]
MFGTHDLALFILAGLLLNITPGPDMVYIASRTASQGFRGGVAAILGINAGCLVHTLAAAIGLSALLMTSAKAFMIVKLIGAAYLFYVGVSMLLERTRNGDAAAPETLPVTDSKRIFWQGFLTNVLNPKVALFFLAFLPQFIAADSAQKPLAFLFLGCLFIFNATFVVLAFAWMVSKARGRVSRSSRIAVWLNRGCGALFVGVGIKLALTERA